MARVEEVGRETRTFCFPAWLHNAVEAMAQHVVVRFGQPLSR